MPIFGVDIHPQFQAGIIIEQIRAEGFDFLSVKLTEGIDTYGGRPWIARGLACGLLCVGYHYLRPGNEIAQARVFARELKLAGVPGVLDFEAVDQNNKPTLTVPMALAFLAECRVQGVNVPLVYLPQWYWQKIGSPTLTGLPALWASSYVSGSNFAASLYGKVAASRWYAYGGKIPKVLQFTDQAQVAGKVIDANVFLGTRDDFAKLIGVSDLTDEEHSLLQDCRDELYRHLATRAGDPNADPKNPYTDTILGYATNADAYGWRNENKSIPAINARLDGIEASLMAVTKLLSSLADALKANKAPST